MASNASLEKQKFLDEILFSSRKIDECENCNGSGFIGPGGVDTAQKHCEFLNVKEDDFVLDVGCGTGGFDFYISQQFGARVLGTDLSVNMIDAAKIRLQKQEKEIRDKVNFQVADADNMDFNKETFDSVFSKDAFFYIQEKAKLFSQIWTWLKPGGTLCIIDYNLGDVTGDQQFQDFISDRHWILYTREKQKQIIKTSGFSNVEALDITQKFLLYLEGVMEEVIKNRNEASEEKTRIHYEDYLVMEEKKKVWFQEDILRWTMYKAKKL